MYIFIISAELQRTTSYDSLIPLSHHVSGEVGDQSSICCLHWRRLSPEEVNQLLKYHQNWPPEHFLLFN